MAVEAAPKVKMTAITHVKPSKPIGKRECQLVTFDLPYLAFYYNQKLMFYREDTAGGGGGGLFEEKVERLKEGLRVVLEEFHQLAGKLVKDDEGVFFVEYDDCMDGGGVEVAEAEAEWVGVDDLAADEGTASFKELIPYNGVLNLEGLAKPLLAVQITKLKDGLAIGCAFNHAILDGTSTWHFMTSWAQICNGANSVAVSPFLDRTKARNIRLKLHLPPPSSAAHAAKQAPPLLRERIFRFPESSIAKIKSKVNGNLQSDGSKPFSTFQSLGSHIWRHVTLARNLTPEDYTVFTVFADCRKRVDPPMPDSYFGNLIQAVFTATAVGFLAGNPPEFAASTIRSAIEAHDAKAIEARNKEWESSPKIFEFKDAGRNCVAVGSSPRFKVYDVDFGWGKPEGVRSGSNNRFDGMVYLYQAKSGGGSIDVEMCLEAGAMEKLENDKEFLMEI